MAAVPIYGFAICCGPLFVFFESIFTFFEDVPSFFSETWHFAAWVAVLANFNELAKMLDFGIDMLICHCC